MKSSKANQKKSVAPPTIVNNAKRKLDKLSKEDKEETSVASKDSKKQKVNPKPLKVAEEEVVDSSEDEDYVIDDDEENGDDEDDLFASDDEYLDGNTNDSDDKEEEKENGDEETEGQDAEQEAVAPVKQSKEVGLDAESNKQIFIEAMQSILNMELPQDLLSKNGNSPILLRPKGVAKRFLKVIQKEQVQSKEDYERQKARQLFFEQNYKKATVKDVIQEKQFLTMARKGLVQLLNQVVKVKKRAQEEKTKEVDDYGILDEVKFKL